MNGNGFFIHLYKNMKKNINNSKQTFVCGPRSYLFWGEHGAGRDFCGSWYQREGSSQSILCSALSNQFLCRRPEIIQCLRLHTFYRSKENQREISLKNIVISFSLWDEITNISLDSLTIYLNITTSQSQSFELTI